MTDKDEALRLALEAMKIKQQVTMWANDGDRAKFNKAIKAVEAALLSQSDGEAQQAKDEPVAYCKVRPLRGDEFFPKIEIDWVGFDWPMTGPLYAAPPRVAEPHKRPSRSDIKPLTDEEMQRIIHEHTKLNPNQRDDKQLIGYIINATRAIEAAHGIIDPADLKGKYDA
jgi:hypothetical protein